MPCQRFFVLSASGVPRTFVDDCSPVPVSEYVHENRVSTTIANTGNEYLLPISSICLT